MSNLLLDSHPLIVLPELACAIGLNEAIVLQQVHYWIEHNRKQKRNFHNGRYWVYNSYKEWQKNFPFWCERTVKTTFSKLENSGLLISGNFNKQKMDKTKWYTIDYDALDRLCPKSRLGKSCPIDGANITQTIPKTNTKNSNRNIRKDESSGFISTPTFSISQEQTTPVREKRDNIFQIATQKYGRERVLYMLSVVDWYIDQAYPAYTHSSHPEESKPKRMVFAEKLLECSSNTVDDDQLIAETLHRALREYKDCDPTIYYITTPRVLGYWLIQDDEVGYEFVNGTEYAPVEAMY